MIKDFYKISQKDLEYLLTHKFTVWEKLDMFYFRVELTKIGAIATKNSTGKVISDIDCVTNSLLKDVCEFVNDKINPVRNEIIDRYGEGTLGFFYLPINKYHKILYKNLNPKTVILSDWSYNFDITSTDGYEHIISLCDMLNVNVPPVISIWSDYVNEELRNIANSYLENVGSDYDTDTIVLAFSKGQTTSYSGNLISDIEGIIIRTDKFQYQIHIKDVEDNLDKSVKLIYRDTLLNSVAEYYEKNQNELDKSFSEAESYIDRVSKLFLSYIENTDLFSKFSFDPEDLLPPSTAYFGDIDFDMISDNNVKLICKYNEVNKNIFRLFLHTFSQKISEDKFSYLPDKTKQILTTLTINLKYKNYKEILLTAYKAKA